MKAIVLSAPGSAEQLRLTELPTPAAQEGEVIVQVKALSINPVDIKTRNGKGMTGRLKDENPIILGWDISGIVTAVGANVTAFKEGDAVFGMVNFPGHGKAYAEYVAAPAAHLALKPDNITHEEAAAATLAALTAWQALVTHAAIKSGDKMLVHAAAGGVGHYAVQIAKYLGAHVTGTSSAANKEFVLGLGADAHIDYKSQRFEEVTGGLDFVLDAFGGDMIERSLEVIRPGGSLITLPTGAVEGLTEKSAAKGINGYHFMVSSNGKDMAILADLLQKGIIKSHVSQVFPLAEIAKAHEQVETGRTVGKVIVRP
ncbi:zinc-binding dehydrogenase [Chitinophaga sp. SYP-B3965]|uniref:NADP-dependent oxidoreductase n=1 Tax=Chitinophaga sp. SYP-B3965 TaxID=2663120 RepID=UPI001299EC9C|nr:NADP-dependent oxidoreductase [Chitinophaga sp. SYP-B3965]MRG45545.1 zinc-binding dehydrogenase [Chitinophaga sp. SYP-B3965]